MSSPASPSTRSTPDRRAETYLGVDGGGTKTALCVLRGDGRVLARVEAPSCYYLGQDISLVEKVLDQGVTEVCAAADVRPSDLSHAFFGLPGYGEVSGDLAALDAAPAAVLGHDRYRCDNDMVCGWAGSLGASDGINVVCGTGSMTYGERRSHGMRVGGWGEVFGDEGSAYWIAVRGLGLFSQMSDGRRPRGPLHALLREHLALETDLDLVDVVLNRWGGARGEVAALSRVVVAAAEQGDALAESILHEAAHALVDLVEATRVGLGWDDGSTVPVSWSGGVFASTVVRESFTRGLELRSPHYELRTPQHDPVVGAALYAARLHGTPVTAPLEET
ncbi:N-acetylglucosamine kinase [Solicola sp. PLA-1-18]|uniref:N-acetylglucosamine kinase n=1 Tax=Solicola sp. PLA-1-18 TaxID=3380532 RepID=UPI003B7A90B0